MKNSSHIILVIIGVCLVVWPLSSSARQSWSRYGNWPRSWPEELDEFRERAGSFSPGPIGTTKMYYIPFYSHDEFQRAWPGLVELVQGSTRITLVDAPEYPRKTDDSRNEGILERLKIEGPAMVMIVAEHEHWVRAEKASVPDATGPPDESGEDSKDGMVRVPETRKSITLHVDGEIIDLNRIRFPKGHPVFDERTNLPADVTNEPK